MKNITTRQYRILADHMDIYQFMLEVYERDWKNGVPAPFLEYALSSVWMDKTYTYKNRIWLDGDRIVGFVFYENPVTDIYFSLRPGYEELASEMVAYADQNMPDLNGNRQFVIFGGQDAIRKAAQELGYHMAGEYVQMQYDFDKPLEYTLPEGFRFVPQGTYDVEKIEQCCWKGFDHEAEEGPWNGDARNNYQLCQAPHATMEYGVAVENEAGEYVCWAGMWWTPENRLAYMEPLCTAPKYRRLGLASAALSELYRRMKPLGATHMTGGGDPFYEKIGYRPAVTWTFWKKGR
ncbi:MAG: GNAT family N-acetyltransferase [Eubacteriales bacterium]|nr:GNAT family N-acetyltransferase [Eubacteriales bacterium]